MGNSWYSHMPIHDPPLSGLYGAVEAVFIDFWFVFDAGSASKTKPKHTNLWYGFGLVLVWFWYGFGMV